MRAVADLVRHHTHRLKDSFLGSLGLRCLKFSRQPLVTLLLEGIDAESCVVNNDAVGLLVIENV
jgi:hypothetical protein